ncbi:MAG: hypothetical protein KBS98_06260 [Flavobacterium sp.]|nr:hypothetical protein [Candidatus Neoflavobacterium equi]
MMNGKLFLFAAVLFSCYSFSQVGIATTDPKATLDITMANPSATATTSEGILIPRMSRTRAANMAAPVTSTLIYVNDVTLGTAGGTTSEVTTIGFYYFNGTKWILLNTPVGDKTDDAFINDTGRVKIGTNAGGTAKAAYTDVVFLDNGMMGLGLDTPQSGIHLVGVSNDSKDDIRIASYHTTPGGNFIFQGSKGTPTAAVKLASGETIGQMNFEANTTDGTPSFVNAGRFYSAYKGKYNGQQTSEFGISIAGPSSPNFVIKNNGRVGINTLYPTAKLSIVADTISRGFALKDGSQGANKILMSDASGNARWDNLSVFKVRGTLSTTGVDLKIAELTNTFVSTNSTITLPPGTWEVTSNMLVVNKDLLLNDARDWFFLKTTFADDSNLTNSTTDIQGGKLISGNYQGPVNPASGGQKFEMITGSVIIKNATSLPKKYTLIAGKTVLSNTIINTTFVLKDAVVDRFGSTNWGENSISAMRID